MGEFVSGNYFRTFGLRPRMGRLFYDADDVTGAPIVAVMSYETWKHDYAGDASVVGSTFWVNTKAVTIAGIAPQGFFGDRLASTPPDFYLPIEAMPVLANVPYVHDPRRALALHDWAREARDRAGLTPGEGKRIAPPGVCTEQRVIHPSMERLLLAKAHIVLTPGGAGILHLQDNATPAVPVDVD